MTASWPAEYRLGGYWPRSTGLMRRPIEAYREGYEKGRTDNAGGVLAEITMGMLRDDPGGYFATGYHDGTAGKKFAPPSEEVRKEAAELNPFDDKVAIKTVCPNCGALDWFEWKFLGKLTDPVCGYTWYAGSGTYVLMQVRAGFQAGSRFTKYLTSGISGEGAWIAKALGWFMGTLVGIGVRLEFGLLMTPIQAMVGLCQRDQTLSERVTRGMVLGVFLVAIGISAYEIQLASRAPNRMSQKTSIFQVPGQRGVRSEGGAGSAQVQDPSSDMAQANAEQARLNRRIEATQRLMLAMELDDEIGASKALEDGADPNMTVESAGMRTHFQPPFSDDTSLHLAILFKSVALTRLLIGHGANVNLRGAPGIAVGNGKVDLTPLREAIAVERPEIVSLLLENGADPNLDQPLKDALRCAETPNGIDGKMSVACAQIVAILKGAQGIETYLGPKPPVADVPYFFDSDGDRWNLFPLDVCPDRRTQNGEITTYTIDGQLASANITVSHRGAAFYVRYAQSDPARQQTLILAPLAEKVGRRETSGVNGLTGLPSIRGTQVAPNIWRYETHDAIPGGQYWVVLPSLDPPFFCFQYNPL
jgi:hypothetical protein